MENFDKLEDVVLEDTTEVAELVDEVEVTDVEDVQEVAPYGDYGISYYSGETPSAEEVMKNKKGKKLRNHFAIKLVVSILELVFCVFSLFFSIPAGILGIVFSSKARKAYKSGKAREFKIFARTSTIILLVGAVTMSILPLRGGFDTLESQNANADHPDFKDFNEVTINGTTLSIPCSYQDLEDLGYFMDYSDTKRYVEPECYKYVYLHTESAIDVLDLCLYNDSTEDAVLTDMSVTYIAFWNCMGENDQWFADYEFVNGLRFGMTEEEVLETLGEPNLRQTWDYDEYTEVYYSWEYSGGEYCYIGVGFVDGLLEYIEISNDPEN